MATTKNSLGLSERQAMFLAVGFYMLTALIMVNVNKVRESKAAPSQKLKQQRPTISKSRNPTLTNSSIFSFFPLSFAVKWALNKISAPWLLLWSQLIIAVILLQFTDLVGLFKMPKLRLSVAKQLVPLIAINVLGLGVNTVCLVYVDTSFYQV
jgi:GDP-fucose transporter C1